MGTIALMHRCAPPVYETSPQAGIYSCRVEGEHVLGLLVVKLVKAVVLVVKVVL